MKHPRLFIPFAIFLCSFLNPVLGKKIKVILCIGYEEAISLNTYPAEDKIKVFVVKDEPANEDFKAVKARGTYEAQGRTESPGIIIFSLEPGNYIAFMEGVGYQASKGKFKVSEHPISPLHLNDFQKKLKKDKKIINALSKLDSISNPAVLQIELEPHSKTILDDFTLNLLRQKLMDYQPGKPNPQFDQFMKQLLEKYPEVNLDPRFQNMINDFIEEKNLIEESFLESWGIEFKNINRY